MARKMSIKNGAKETSAVGASIWHACVRGSVFAANLRSHNLEAQKYFLTVFVLAAIIVIPQSTISMEVIHQVPFVIQILVL